MTSNLLLFISAPRPPTSEAELIATCRKLVKNDYDWLFLTSSHEFVALQLNNHSLPPSQSEALFHESFDSLIPEPIITIVEPTLGHVQRSGQKIPLHAHTTVVSYRTSPGDRGTVIDDCRELFKFAEESELDVYSLAIMNDISSEDRFVILERYESKQAEQRHLDSERCVACLKKIKGLITGHDSRSYKILDV
jgi:quinol monooxygenase YgiN